jgi:hypothetical protein
MTEKPKTCLRMGGDPNVLGVELPKCCQLVVHVEDPEMTVKESVVLLDRQNEGLDTDGWVIARSSESRDATSSHFTALISDGPLEVLKTLSFKTWPGNH